MKRLLLILAILPLLIASNCGDPDVAGGADLNPHFRAEKLVRAGTSLRTPKGAPVFPESGVSIDSQEYQAIDDGLDSVFAKVRCNYPGTPAGHPGFRHSEWEVVVFRSEITPGGNVAFRVPVDGYAGTKWDQGGFIYAGAMVTGVVGESYTIALPDSQGRLEAFRNGADYEGEHWWLATVDPEKYRATEVHGQGQGHPIIPGCGNALKAQPEVPALTVRYDAAPGFAGREIFYCVIPVD